MAGRALSAKVEPGFAAVFLDLSRGIVTVILADAPANGVFQRSLRKPGDTGPIGDPPQLDDRRLDRHRGSLSLLHEGADGIAEGIPLARAGRIGESAQSVEGATEIVRRVAKPLTLSRIAFVPYGGCQGGSLSGIGAGLSKV